MQIKNFILAIAIILFVFNGAGCRSTGKPVDNSILEHQRRIVELEGTIGALTERLGQYDALITGTVERLELIRERAAGITDSIDRLEYLILEYERTVWELIRQLREASGEISAVEKEFIQVALGYDYMDGS